MLFITRSGLYIYIYIGPFSNTHYRFDKVRCRFHTSNLSYVYLSIVISPRNRFLLGCIIILHLDLIPFGRGVYKISQMLNLRFETTSLFGRHIRPIL